MDKTIKVTDKSILPVLDKGEEDEEKIFNFKSYL